MSSQNLDNLVTTGQLKTEPYNQNEFNGLIHSGSMRLKDACNENLAVESRFDLAYNAAHALSLAALRRHGYRSNNRFIVFQVLSYTAGVGPEIWRILAKCHNQRNIAEYEGDIDIDVQLLSELISATQVLLKQISTNNL